jgi:hypothetical protein
MAMEQADGVHEPSHGLGVCVDIRCGNVAIGPDDGRNLGGITPGEALQLAERKLLGILKIGLNRRQTKPALSHFLAEFRSDQPVKMCPRSRVQALELRSAISRKKEAAI